MYKVYGNIVLGKIYMKILISTLTLIISMAFNSQVFSCSDVFLNKGKYHIEARTLDFLVNLGFQDKIGFISEDNITDIILDADKIPNKQLTTWKNKYGYFGRAAFNGEKIIDGMNTQGLSVSILYLPGTKFPAYDPKDQKPVLSIYDIASYLLSQARTVSESLELIRSRQLVQSAVKEKEGYFIKDIPIHYAIRDKTGASAVIEFINGTTKIHENAGDILTNAPSLEWQLQNASYYDSLLADNKNPTEKFSKSFHEYEEIYKVSSFKGEANLMGTPGDSTPPSRFARARVLLNNFPAPSSKQVALYQASSLIDSLAVPALRGASPTLWSSIKDLDDGVYYVKNIVVFQGDKSLYSMPITSGYMAIDLKLINFNIPDPTYNQMKVEPTNPKDIKTIVSADIIKLTGINE